MKFNEWKEKNNVDLSKYCGNVGDYEGNICIQNSDGSWIFWNSKGELEKIIVDK